MRSLNVSTAPTTKVSLTRTRGLMRVAWTTLFASTVKTKTLSCTSKVARWGMTTASLTSSRSTTLPVAPCLRTLPPSFLKRARKAMVPVSSSKASAVVSVEGGFSIPFTGGYLGVAGAFRL